MATANPTPYLPQSFVTAARQKRLLPFIGAGFSKNVCEHFPNWSQLTNESAKLVNCDHSILNTQGNFYQIAEYLDIKGRLPALYKIMAERLDSPKFTVERSRVHRLLPYLDTQSIFTTNWDSWIEKGFQYESIPYATIVGLRDFVSPRPYKLPSAPPRSFLYTRSVRDKMQAMRKFSPTTIVKFHGDFSDRASLVFTETNYLDRLDFDSPLDVKLRSEIIGRSVVFIGYSFTDLNVRYLWHKLTKLMITIDPKMKKSVESFFVTYSRTPLQASLLRRLNITTIYLNPADKSRDLERFLKRTINIQNGERST